MQRCSRKSLLMTTRSLSLFTPCPTLSPSWNISLPSLPLVITFFVTSFLLVSFNSFNLCIEDPTSLLLLHPALHVQYCWPCRELIYIYMYSWISFSKFCFCLLVLTLTFYSSPLLYRFGEYGLEPFSKSFTEIISKAWPWVWSTVNTESSPLEISDADGSCLVFLTNCKNEITMFISSYWLPLYRKGNACCC